MSRTNAILILILVCLSLALTSCGASKTKMTSGSQTLSSNTDMQAICNRASSSDFTILISNDYDSAGNTATGSLRAKILSLSGDLALTTSSANLSFRAYGYDGSGNQVTSPGTFPFYFALEGSSLSSAPLLTNAMLSVRASDILALSQTLRNYGVTANSLTEILNKTYIVIMNLSYSFDVLHVSEQSGSAVKAQQDILMTPFDLNPDTYAADHPSSLVSLHPFHNYLGSHQNDSFYSQMSTALCR